MKDRFLGFSDGGDYVAIIDNNLITEDFVDEKIVPVVEDYTVSDDNLVSLFTSYYTSSITDNKYIYTFNKENYQFNVYDILTLEKVYNERFLMKPEQMDVDANKLVISFGGSRQFRIYNSTSWDYETVYTPIVPYSIIIYQDRVIYTGFQQHYDVLIYNTVLKTHKSLPYNPYYTYNVSIAINRTSGILFLADRDNYINELTFYNLNTNTVLYEEQFSRAKTKVRFDGYFLHYEGQTWDGFSLKHISSSDEVRSYQVETDYNNIKTIYDNNQISVFTANYDNQDITVIYDLTNILKLGEVKAKATNAYQVGNKIVILSNESSIIQIFNLEY